MAKPIHEIRVRDLRAAIWSQTTDGREWFNVSIVRCYEQGGQFKEASSFRRDDLPVVAKLADMAYAWIWSQRPNEQSEERR